MQQRESRDGDFPVTLSIARLPHRVVVRERHERHSRRVYSTLHCERDRRDAALLDGFTYQADGPVAQRSGWREQDRVNTVVGEHPGDLRRCLADERAWVVDRTHEREVAVVDLPNDAFFHESSGGP